MRWTCDRNAGALYFTFQDGFSASQVEIDDGVVLDFDSDGAILGTEVILPIDEKAAKLLADALPSPDDFLLTEVIKAFQGGLGSSPEGKITLRERKTDCGELLFADAS